MEGRVHGTPGAPLDGGSPHQPGDAGGISPAAAAEHAVPSTRHHGGPEQSPASAGATPAGRAAIASQCGVIGSEPGLTRVTRAAVRSEGRRRIPPPVSRFLYRAELARI